MHVDSPPPATCARTSAHRAPVQLVLVRATRALWRHWRLHLELKLRSRLRRALMQGKSRRCEHCDRRSDRLLRLMLLLLLLLLLRQCRYQQRLLL